MGRLFMRRRSLEGRLVLVVLRLCWRSFRWVRGWRGVVRCDGRVRGNDRREGNEKWDSRAIGVRRDLAQLNISLFCKLFWGVVRVEWEFLDMSCEAGIWALVDA